MDIVMSKIGVKWCKFKISDLQNLFMQRERDYYSTNLSILNISSYVQ